MDRRNFFGSTVVAPAATASVVGSHGMRPVRRIRCIG